MVGVSAQSAHVDPALLDTAAVLAAHVATSLDAAFALRRERLSAVTDSLTGILNRRGLEERMGIEITRALRQKSPMSVAVVDIDHFKTVNDEHGHEVGDRVLAWVGAVLDRQTRGVDAAARTGGDEFTVFMPDADRAAARRFADRVRQAVARSDPQGRSDLGVPDTLRITVSVGVATGGPHEADALVQTADRVLYAAKGEGRNRVVAAEHGELRRAAV